MLLEKIVMTGILALSLSLLGFQSLAFVVHSASQTRPHLDGLLVRENLPAAAPSAEILAQAVTSVTLTPSKDNTLYENVAGSLSDGAGEFFFVGRTNQTAGASIRRGLIAFDIAGNIPPGSTILSVTLRLNLSQARPGNQSVILHRLQADWGEGISNAGSPGGQGAAATTNDATWLHRFFNTSLWTSAGGDFVGTASATTLVGSEGSYTWSTTPQLIADVQSWLNTPAANFGWLLQGNEASTLTAKRFDSRENSTSANRPALIIEFVAPSLTVAKTVNNSIPSPGEVITYTIVVANNTALNLTNAVVSDTLPISFTLAGAVTLNPPGAGTPGVAPPLLVTGLTISAGHRITVTFPVTIDAGLTTGQITNTAAVTSTQIPTPTTGAVVVSVGGTRAYLPIIAKTN